MGINNEYDVAIVGAGVTGLTAALTLLEMAQSYGRPVPRLMVLEAEDQPGGRIKSRLLSNGVTVNEGAHWAHGGMSNEFFRWARERYDLGSFNEDTAENQILITDSSDISPRFKAQAMTRIQEAWAAFKQ